MLRILRMVGRYHVNDERKYAVTGIAIKLLLPVTGKTRCRCDGLGYIRFLGIVFEVFSGGL